MTGAIFDEAFTTRLGELFRWRRGVRRFRSETVPADMLEKLLEVANLAPSVGLSQPWRFVIIDDPDRRARVRANFEQCNARALASQSDDQAAAYARLKLAGLDEAPCHFCVFAEPEPYQGRGLGRQTMPQTTAYSAVMAVHTLWLMARAENLGLGWVSILDPTTIRSILDMPEDWIFIGYFCLGYPQIEGIIPELECLGWEFRRPIRQG